MVALVLVPPTYGIHEIDSIVIINLIQGLRSDFAGGLALSFGDIRVAQRADWLIERVAAMGTLVLRRIGDPTERRKRAVKRGRVALDALDELKVGLLGGALSPAPLTKLQAAAADLKDGSGDAGLDTVLGEIELRVEVEIANMAPR